MVQIPSNVRPYIDFVAKQHFWLLMPLVPLLVLPLVFMAKGSLRQEIEAARGQIDSRLSALRSVEGTQPHPNESWSEEINKRTTAVKRETLAEWQRFWQSQQPLRVWPAALGDDFVQRAAGLKPDGKLPRKLLERYQNSVRALVRQLPARMGADEAMVEAVAPPSQPGQTMRSNKLVVWSTEDQVRIYSSFDWEKPPSTMQVVLAQEELWVYGLLCDSIARVNKVAAGPYNSPIPLVQQLAIGYGAAEDDPGGSRGGRIVVAAAPAEGGMPPLGEDMAPPPMDGAAPAAAAIRPPHPRFGGGGAGPGAAAAPPPPPEEGGAAAPAASPDDPLENWIYVDFNGRPLTAQELAASPDATMVHLMPFAIRAVVDERYLDAWLVDLARSPVPIDVRQVRINAGATSSLPQFGAALPEAGPAFQNTTATTGRRHDVVVELRGTVALATPPDEKLLGIEPEAVAEPAAQPPADPAPPEQAAPEPAPAEQAPAEQAPAEQAPAEPAAEPPPAALPPQPEAQPPAVQEPAA